VCVCVCVCVSCETKEGGDGESQSVAGVVLVCRSSTHMRLILVPHGVSLWAHRSAKCGGTGARSSGGVSRAATYSGTNARSPGRHARLRLGAGEMNPNSCIIRDAASRET